MALLPRRHSTLRGPAHGRGGGTRWGAGKGGSFPLPHAKVLLPYFFILRDNRFLHRPLNITPMRARHRLAVRLPPPKPYLHFHAKNPISPTMPTPPTVPPFPLKNPP